jgi:hypothetical protein
MRSDASPSPSPDSGGARGSDVLALSVAVLSFLAWLLSSNATSATLRRVEALAARFLP